MAYAKTSINLLFDNFLLVFNFLLLRKISLKFFLYVLFIIDRFLIKITKNTLRMAHQQETQEELPVDILLPECYNCT